MSATPCRLLLLAALTSVALNPSELRAQSAPSEPENESIEEERAGGSRGGSYAWGESSTDSATPSGPEVRRYARIFGSVGAGLTIRILEYHLAPDLDQTRLAPPYLQLRGGYFFEGSGTFQHGIGLGISTILNGEGTFDIIQSDGSTLVRGVDPFAAWTFTPQYLLRIWFDDWIQLMGRVGASVTAAAVFNWGWEVGIGPVIKFLAGFGAYADISFSMFFGNQYHPLISGEVGLVIDYELLP